MQKAIDETDVARRAAANLNAILPRLMDHRGFADPDVVRLGGPDAPRKRLTEFRASPYGGGWRCSGDGSSGADLIDLVAHLGSCDRQTAARFLARVVPA